MKKGISLVMLIITIVVLAILTGTVIITTIDSNIMGNTQTTVDMYNKKAIIEDINIKIQTEKLKKVNQGIYKLKMTDIMPIIQTYGDFDNITLKLTTTTTTKPIEIWLYEIMNIPLEEYATITYTNKTLTVTTELPSDLYSVQYTTKGGASWELYNSPVTIAQESGIQIRLLNTEGTVVSNTLKLTNGYAEEIDDTNPSIRIEPNGIGLAKKMQVTITVTDDNELATNNTYKYCLIQSQTSPADNSSEWKPYTNGEAFTIGTGLTGTYYLHVKAVNDVAGNTSGNVVSNSYYFDNQPPEEFTPTVISKTTTSITIGGTTEDNNELAVTYEYSINNGTDWQYSNTFTGLTAGTTYNQIQVKAKDTLGNERVSSNISVVTGGPSDGSYVSTKGVNSPKLGTGMMAVYWNDEGEEITSTSPETDLDFNYSQWYDYIAQPGATTTGGTSKWANAKTTDGSYWVWIPRYGYSITSGYHTNTAGVIDIEFLKDKTNVSTTGRTSWNNASGQGNWNIQPAFSFKNSSNNSVELSGIWMSKFLMSRNDSTITSVGSNNVFSSKPNKLALSHDLTGDVYTWGINYKSTLKSHLIKSTEWGAVAYLAHSKYGRNGTVVSMNRCTTSISGAGPTAHNSTTTYEYNASNFGTTYSYLSANGKLASTTGNIYGVYDMSGRTQHTASYINTSSYLTDYAKSLSTGLAEYKVVYPITGGVDHGSIFNAAKSMYGDSMYEIASGSNGNYAWFGQHITAAGGEDPIFSKGHSGLFGTHWYRPQPGYAYAHVRFVLWCD